MYKFESELHKQGFSLIAGVDEVGRGPLAGPLVVACVVLNKKRRIPGLDDSKKLTQKKREELYEKIMEKAVSVHRVFVDVETIDKINILEATKMAMRKVIQETDHDFVLIDAVNLNVENTQSIIKGDTLSASIAAASIVAKVERDRFMIALDEKYPMYDFKNNKGYGTPKHLKALEEYGVIAGVHRLSFGPVKNAGQISFDFK